ncbi:MAG: N-acetylmuramoyl-L-alanine amidase, partial [Pseudoxanthomonas sp.]
VETGATGTRAEIQLEGMGAYKTISLAGPARLVVDLPASHAMRGLKLPAGAGVIESVRTGQPTPDTFRIVFDLSSSVVALKPRLEPTSSGATLVLEWPGDGPVASVKPQGAAVPGPTVANNTQSAAAATAALTSAVQQQAVTRPVVATLHGTPQGASPATSHVPSQVTTREVTTPEPASREPVSRELSAQAILNGRTITPVPTIASAAPAAASPAPATQYTIATGLPTAPPAPTVEAEPEPYKPAPPQTPMRAGMRQLVIAIDAGHGGQDPGAVGPTGKREKDVTLAMARELGRQINATPGMKAFLVRDGDFFIPLPQRARKARTNKADMFVSIHADAAENRSARGSSVYVLSLKGASSQRARWLADKENASDLVGGVRLQQVDNTLSSVLLDLAQSGHMKASEDAAGHVLDGLKRVGNNHKPNIERANFAVLRTSDMPSMLVETAFISNADEELRLIDPAYQRKVAGAVLDGVQTYFTRQPPPGTLFAARAQAIERAAANGSTTAGSAGAP